MTEGAYRASGVDIDAQDAALARVKELVAATRTEGVLSELGSFGGLFAAPSGIPEPILVASADGVGTKLRVAARVGDFSTVGTDLVNHCVNDVLVQGAVPLFFLDYVGAGVLEPDHVVALVEGVAAACRANGCALLGGETAEMPGFYRPGDYELVGFVVGVVARQRLLGPGRVEPGDRLVGLPSSGLHTNGYSLARRLVFETAGLEASDLWPGDGQDRSVGEVLLAPHRTYLPALRPLLADSGLHAMAHVTGGGLTDNVPRSLPAGCRAVIDRGTWAVPNLFRDLRAWGEVTEAEMLRVFNMGVGMILVVAAERCDAILSQLREGGEEAWMLGRVESGPRGVEYRSS